MGRPAEQIEALQARVRELEGRCRALRSKLDVYERRGPEFPSDCTSVEQVREHFGVDEREAVPPVLVAGDALDEGRAAWFAEIGLKAPTPVEAAHAAAEDEPTP